jgi:protein tyrosine phosphatase (PTP) superfamily phosphohydrolase (DUF442 family)
MRYASQGLAAILCVVALEQGFATPPSGDACKLTPIKYRYSAEPVECPGVGNLYRVAPNLYRSAQPEAKGFAHLAHDLGIRTVVNLRDDLADSTLDLPRGLGLRLVQIKISSLNIPQGHGELLYQALRAIRAGERRGPVLVHCERGSDRTGTVIALYRIIYQGWRATDAIVEMEQGPYDFNRLYALIPDFLGNVPDFVASADRRPRP